MDNWTIGQLDYWTTGLLDNWTDGQLDQWTTGLLDNWTIGQLDYWTTGLLDGIFIPSYFRTLSFCPSVQWSLCPSVLLPATLRYQLNLKIVLKNQPHNDVDLPSNAKAQLPFGSLPRFAG